MPNYLFNPQDYPAVPSRHDAVDDEFFFRQPPARGLGQVTFHDWRSVYRQLAHVPNVARLFEQAEGLVAFLTECAPEGEQKSDLEFLLNLGHLFTLVVYGQLIGEQAVLSGLDEDVLDQIFDVLVRDFSAYAVALHGKPSSSQAQQDWAVANVRKPVVDESRFDRLWAQVAGLADAYEMSA